MKLNIAPVPAPAGVTNGRICPHRLHLTEILLIHCTHPPHNNPIVFSTNLVRKVLGIWADCGGPHLYSRNNNSCFCLSALPNLLNLPQSPVKAFLYGHSQERRLREEGKSVLAGNWLSVQRTPREKRKQGRRGATVILGLRPTSLSWECNPCSEKCCSYQIHVSSSWRLRVNVIFKHDVWSHQNSW